MVLEQLKSFFMWSTILNYGILVFWLLLLTFAKGWFGKMQRAFFPIPEDKFMTYQYVLYGVYKLAILIFNLIPFIALTIIG